MRCFDIADGAFCLPPPPPAECDYVWMKPVQAPDANDPASKGMQFFFDYIMPDHPGKL